MQSTEIGKGTGTYVYDQRWQHEGQRLAGMEELWDPGTKSLIEELGIAPGWRCLEVGAGGGSIAVWLAEQVGGRGEVLATDVDLTHMDGLARPGLEIRRHDILSDPLPREHFDLVHARLVVEHIGGRALERMAAAVRPGGWLLVESFDLVSLAMDPANAAAIHVVDAVLSLMRSAGYDPTYGRKLVHELERAGLEEVAADGRIGVYRGGTSSQAFVRLTIESVAERLTGSTSQREISIALAALDDPRTVFLTPPMIAARGVKARPS
jgi:SAM-dependent methyltransferase